MVEHVSHCYFSTREKNRNARKPSSVAFRAATRTHTHTHGKHPRDVKPTKCYCPYGKALVQKSEILGGECPLPGRSFVQLSGSKA
eukprot:2630346-Amphidinium_carterae.1